MPSPWPSRAWTETPMREADRCYAVLGLEYGAPWEEVRLAYRKLVRDNHPDRASEGAARIRREERLRRINRAYAILKVERQLGPSRKPSLRSAGPDGYSRESAYAAYTGVGAPEEASQGSEADQAVRLYYEGLHAFQRGELAEAVSALRRSVCLSPGNPDAHRVLGLAFQRTGRLGKAIAAFEQFLRFDPENEEAALLLAMATRQAGDGVLAAGICRSFLERHPEAEEVCALLGEVDV